MDAKNKQFCAISLKLFNPLTTEYDRETSIQPFVHNSLTTIGSNKETFLQDLLIILKRMLTITKKS